MTYAEKLKDPRWQKKRLEIFQRDGWKCRLCNVVDVTLHVHHKKYTANLPHEEPEENLETLCKHCHLIEERIKKDGVLANYTVVLKGEEYRVYLVRCADGGVRFYRIYTDESIVDYVFGCLPETLFEAAELIKNAK